MRKIISLIVLVALIAVGYYYYTGKTFKVPSSPADAYAKIMALGTQEQAQAFQKTIESWVKDPVANIPYPKGWRKVSITNQKEAFDVITSDANNPPQYYVSFSFPKKLIPKMNLIKCVGTAKDKITDICMVGDNPEINAYFKIMNWLRANPMTTNPGPSIGF